MINTVKFNNVEGIAFVGDVHGEWRTLGYKAVEQYQLEHYVIIQLGDFGIGFNSEEYNKAELKRLNTKLKKKNNQLVVIHGNHDDKSYFNNLYSKSYSNIHLVSDYTIINVSFQKDVPDDINILCIGGGLSIDRTKRKEWKLRNPNKNFYWEDEMPVYDESKLDEINQEYPNNIDVVASHTAPSFVFPYTKDGVASWMDVDPQLKDDLDLERNTMDKIFNKIKDKQ